MEYTKCHIMVDTFFMKRHAAVTLNACIKLQLKSLKRQKEGTVTSYGQAASHLLEMYVTDDVIAETDADRMHFYASIEKGTYVRKIHGRNPQNRICDFESATKIS